MDEEGTVKVLPIKLAPQSRHHHHRKLKALTLVDAHDAHHIFVLGESRRLAEVLFIFLQAVNKAQELKEAFERSALELTGPVIKGA